MNHLDTAKLLGYPSKVVPSAKRSTIRRCHGILILLLGSLVPSRALADEIAQRPRLLLNGRVGAVQLVVESHHARVRHHLVLLEAEDLQSLLGRRSAERDVGLALFED